MNKLSKTALWIAMFATAASVNGQNAGTAPVEIVDVQTMINNWYDRKDSPIKESGWSITEGKQILVVEGTSAIGKKASENGFQLSRTIAYEKAFLEAKKQCVKAQSERIESDLELKLSKPEQGRIDEEIDRLVKDGIEKSDATKVAQAMNSDNPASKEADTLNTPSTKSEKIVSNQLDQAIRAGGGDPNQAQPKEKIAQILTSSSFKSNIKSMAAAKCVGMQVIASFEAIPSPDVQGRVGVIAVQSDLMKSVSEAFVTGNWKYVPKGEPGKAVGEYIPKSDQALLLRTLGTRIVRDQDGDYHILAYGQATPASKGGTAEDIAWKEADLKSRNQISSFLGEQVTNNQRYSSSEEIRGLPNGDEIVANGDSSDESIRAVGNNLMRGVTIRYKTKIIHPVTGLPVMLVVTDMSAKGLKGSATMAAPPKLEDQTKKSAPVNNAPTPKADDLKRSNSFGGEGVSGRDF
jgi:hypothetical protein